MNYMPEKRERSEFDVERERVKLKRFSFNVKLAALLKLDGSQRLRS
jgi:hypothetical protein